MAHGAFPSPKSDTLALTFRAPHELQQTSHLQDCQRPEELDPEIALQIWSSSMADGPVEVCPNIMIGTTAHISDCSHQVSHVVLCSASPCGHSCMRTSCSVSLIPILTHESLPEVCHRLSRAATTVQSALTNGGRVLIASKTGNSTPVAVAVGYLMMYRATSFFEAYVTIRRMCVSAKLVDPLRQALLLFDQERSARAECVMEPLGDRVLLEKRPQPGDGVLTCSATVQAVGPEVAHVNVGDLVLIPEEGGEQFDSTQVFFRECQIISKLIQ
eukprot:TRINITY_DN18501_c0_g1_i1.p2 TRINITY_DN18501_c0_g1~~TRINITY_DN18501_c0_g1_i1.p2  ORF type:complete len:272 (-),score=64.80 TRINITY_DN18501_c0_g1_i1:295-1110(-)